MQQVDINGVPITYENKDEIVFESDPNEPCEQAYLDSFKEPEEAEETSLLDDLAEIVRLGEELKTEKINCSFRSIFEEEKK